MRRNIFFSLDKVQTSLVLIKTLCDILIVSTSVVVIDRVAHTIFMVVTNNSIKDSWFILNISVMISASVLRLVFSLFSNKITFKISAKIKINVREKIYSKLLDLEMSYKDIKKTGGLITTSIEGVEALEVFFGLFLPQIFLSILIPFGLYFYLRIYQPTIALALVLGVPLIPLCVGAVQAWIRHVSRMHWSTYEDLNSLYLDSIQGITTLKLFNLVEQRTNTIRTRSWEFRNRTMKLLYTNLVSILTMDIIALMGTALGITLAITYLSTHLITLAGAIVVLFLSYEMFRPLRRLGSAFHVAMNGISASKSIFEILDQKTKLEKSKPFSMLSSNDNFDIEFCDVNFTYTTDTPQVLKGVNFIAKTDQITAIVGISGSGKSTIANLIVKLCEPTSGQIYIDKHDIENISRNNIRKHIAMVSQRTYLFHGTIRENLLIARPESTEEELYVVCKKAGIDCFIKSLPNGLDSSLVEHAKNISAGQIQRFGIARALLKDTPILILDEPTADVDRENEAKIIETIKEISKNKTTIIIAHRLSTIRDSDKIIVLNNGIISEEGTHEELMEKNSVYVNLVHHQLEHESADVKEEMIKIYATVSGGGSARKPRDRRGSKDRGCTE